MRTWGIPSCLGASLAKCSFVATSVRLDGGGRSSWSTALQNTRSDHAAVPCKFPSSRGSLWRNGSGSTRMRRELNTIRPRFRFSPTGQQWYFARHKVSVADLLPLSPRRWLSLLEDSGFLLLEWWLKAHLDAGCRIVLLPEDEICEMLGAGENSYIWAYGRAT
ncbi:hypothetical protein BC828DRAFT_22797 [Blastocladiella britannica]|nr:hypothetical protein BC828DRAFT_22797 [Blastocladiella britannica]